MGGSNSVLNAERAKLSKNGKKLLDEFVLSCANLTIEEQQAQVTSKVKELQETHALPPIRLIDFDGFWKLKRLPRCPDRLDKTVTLDSINRNESLLIFISHCWLRGHKAAKDWSGKPHPDTVAGDKYKLCLEGIEWVKRNMAPRMKHCYVWLDFGCINQDGNPAGELEQLDKIVECCDAIFTPIVDLHSNWELPPTSTDLLNDYKAKLWNEGPHAYLNRGWCRVEMLYAANIPVMESERTDAKRHTMFDGGLAFHCQMNRRPHFLFGHREMALGSGPLILPPLQYSYFNDYHPLKGNLSVASDIDHIQTLIDELMPYMDRKLGYVGELDAEGLKRGHGMFRYDNGDVYEGQWKHDQRHGEGRLQYLNGDVYQGSWVQDVKEGQGTLHYLNGEVYEGQWLADNRQGEGVFRYLNGDVYSGHWRADERSGAGVLTLAGDKTVLRIEWKENQSQSSDSSILYFANGDVYDGEWYQVNHVAGQMFKGKMVEYSHIERVFSGHGFMSYCNGDTYTGQWKDSCRDGYGTYTFALGSYEGEWQNNRSIGKGTIRYSNGVVHSGEWMFNGILGSVDRDANGDVYQGAWHGGLKHGRGVLLCHNGSVFDGHWKNNLKDGLCLFNSTADDTVCNVWYDCGVLMGTIKGCINDGMWRIGFIEFHYVNGDIYKGEWVDNNWHGKGIIKYANGDVFDGHWKYNEKSGLRTVHTNQGVTNEWWSKDKLVGVVHGSVKDCMTRNGILNLHYVNGDVYEGEWLNDFKHGQGKMKYANGDVYQGGWNHDLRSGMGSHISANGDTLEGEWKCGKLLQKK